MNPYLTLVIGVLPALVTWFVVSFLKASGENKAVIVTVLALGISGIVYLFIKNTEMAVIIFTSIGASGTVQGLSKYVKSNGGTGIGTGLMLFLLILAICVGCAYTGISREYGEKHVTKESICAWGFLAKDSGKMYVDKSQTTADGGKKRDTAGSTYQQDSMTELANTITNAINQAFQAGMVQGLKAGK